MPIFLFWRLWLLRSTSWRRGVSQHIANMLLSTLRTPPEEEEERGGGGAKPEWEGRGATKEEGTSIVMVGAIGF
jgi:hypothetical protein